MKDYQTAYKKGFEDGLKVVTEVDFKIKLVQVLNNTKGVGDKTIMKALETLRMMEVENNG